jgi:SAM-dependent methyltransferase
MLNYDVSTSTELCEIMGRHGSDKGSSNITTSWHNYTTLYDSLFRSNRMSVTRVFELGLGTNYADIPSNMGVNGKPGASLRGWREYFPNANIFGADIDRRVLFEEQRIKTYYCDQLVPSIIAKMWSLPDLNENFDIIIEDGLHSHHANVVFFENSIHKLKKGGYYIIEDISNQDVAKFNSTISSWAVKYPNLKFHLETLPSALNFGDNRLLVVHRIE